MPLNSVPIYEKQSVVLKKVIAEIAVYDYIRNLIVETFHKGDIP